MTKRTRTIQRIAALTLCAVLLSVGALPVALADVADLPPITMEEGRMIVEDIKGLMSSYAREGAVRDIYRQVIGGSLQGETLVDAENKLAEAIRNRQLVEQSSAALRAAGRTPHTVYDGTKSASQVVQENLDDAANTNVSFARDMVSKLAVLGLFISVPDWGRAYNNAIGQGHLNDPYIETGDVFQDFLVNTANLDGIMNQFVLQPLNNAFAGTGAHIDNPDYMTLWTKGNDVIANFIHNTFGGGQGVQALPVMDIHQVLNMANCTILERDNIGATNGGVLRTTYEAPDDVRYYEYEGQHIEIVKYSNNTEAVGYRKVNSYDDLINGRWEDGIAHPGMSTPSDLRLHIIVFEGKYTTIQKDFPDEYNVYIYVAETMGDIIFQRGGANLYAKGSDLGLPSVDYTNDLADIQSQLDDIKDKLDSIDVKIPTQDPTGDPYVDFAHWYDQMRNWNAPDAMREATAETTDPTNPGDTDPGDNDPGNPEPSPPDEDDPPPDDDDPDWDKLRNSWSGLAKVFPFCLPFDIVGIFTGFAQEPEPLPPIEANILPFIPGDAGVIRVDFNLPGVDTVIKIIRTGLLILFVVGLILATRGLMTW